MERFVYFLSDKYWNELGDPRINDWPVIHGGLWRILAIVLFYLVFTRIILPNYMKDRKAYNLKKTMMVYNTFMVITNFYFFCIALAELDYGRIFLDFTFPSREDRSAHTMFLLNIIWFGYLIRLIDFLDTVFFVLRKNERQVTLLHLYHHGMVPIIGWITLKFNAMVPGFRLFVVMNAFIHSLMYGYYALAALGPSVQKYLWWKKYITILQLAQFVVLGIYAAICTLFQEGYPIELLFPVVTQPPLFFLMFYHFYRQTYKNAKQKTD